MEFITRNEVYVTANCKNGINHTSFEELKNEERIGLLEDASEKNRSTKEEIDIIDGVHFISFESESDLLEFTKIQKMTMEKLKEKSKKDEKSIEGKIIPTKTHDITKIKGWRNKIFITNLNESPDSVPNEIQPEGTKSNSNYSANEPDIKIEQCDTNSHSAIEKRVTSDILSNNRIFLREFPDMLPRMHQICFDKEFSHILKKINDIYSESIKTDVFLDKIKSKLPDETSLEGIFQCSLTDEFLDKHADFEVSYGDRDSRHWDEAKYEEALELATKKSDSKIPINLIVTDEKPKKTCMEEVAEAHSKFYAYAEQTGKFKLKKHIVIKGKNVQLDFGNPRKSDSDMHRSILADNTHLSSRIKEEPCEPSFPTLIPQTFNIKGLKEEADCLFSIHSGFDNPQRLVMTLPCSISDDDHDHSNCFNTDSKTVILAIALNVGIRRPFNEDAIQNLQLLKKDPEIIDCCWANIAASAVQNFKSKRTIKRIIVPVVSKKLKDIARSSIENIRRITDVKAEVKNVVEDVIDYVIRKETLDQLDYPYDPDVNPTTISTTEKPVLKKNKKSKVERELRRLINVTLVEENKNLDNNENNCTKEHCSKGCVCPSLDGTLSVIHCKKLECMFECSCNNKNYLPRETIVAHGVDKTKLAKEESLWHKTVICKSNDVIIEGETGKAKREKKLPTRFRNNVLLYSLDISPNAQSNWKDFTSSNNISKQCSKGIKLTMKKCDTKSPSKIGNNKVIESENSTFDCFKKPFPPKPKPTKNSFHHSKQSIDSNLLLKNQSATSFNSEKKPLKDMLNVNQDLSEDCTSKILKEDCTSKILKEDCTSKILNEDFLPPDFDEESLIEMEEVILSSDEDEDLDEDSDPLDDAFIWCTVHYTYNCQCCNAIFFLKTNTICRCRDRLKTLSRKDVSMALSNSFNFSRAHLHDRTAHSARTVGTHFNYTIRNKSPGFKTKRKLEIDYEILSNTNSLYKISIQQLRDVVKKEKNISSEPTVIAHDIKTELNGIIENPVHNDTFMDDENLERCEISKTGLHEKPLLLEERENVKQPLPVGQVLSSEKSLQVRLSNNETKPIRIEKTSSLGQSILLGQSQVIKQPLHAGKPIIPIIIKPSLHVGRVLGAGQPRQTEHPHSIEQPSTQPQYIKADKKTSSFCEKPGINNVNLEENRIGFEKENKIRRRKYRIGPAHFETSRCYRTVFYKNKPKSQNSFSFEKKTANGSLPNNDAPDLKPSDIISDKESSTCIDIKTKPHKLGLLCLTDGFGYLPVKQYTNEKISVRDPLVDDVYHNFKDLEAANIWLNRFFKGRLLFEDINYNLKWVIIKPNLMAKMKLFDKTVLFFDSKAVNKNGVLMDKNKFTAEYIRASKKSQIQIYKADHESMSLPANNTIKILLENASDETENVPNKKLKTDHSNTSEVVDPPVPPLVVIDRSDLSDKPIPRTINLGNHGPGSTKKYSFQLDLT